MHPPPALLPAVKWRNKREGSDRGSPQMEKVGSMPSSRYGSQALEIVGDVVEDTPGGEGLERMNEN